MQDLINHTKNLLTEHRKNVLALDVMEIISTRGIISRSNNYSGDDTSVEGSFRKLQID